MKHLLILDIETVPQEPSYTQLNPYWQKLWHDKISKTMPENISAEEFYLQRASVMAEFGKIICISTGIFYEDKGKRLCFKLKSLIDDNEITLLEQFIELVNTHSRLHRDFQFAGHNIREFDIPYLCRRLIINNMKLPPSLQLSGKKPWETQMTDTLQLWKFGDYKHFTSLKLLAACLGINTPKEDMDGSMVREVFYEQKDMLRIAEYCQKDVITVAQILLRLENKPLIPEENIFTV
ncbi:MAG TPA: ribonuclease H-like domain-containing protein [Chitinophagaceae bacterium]|nr:ribonuclease H-like domain-containing protein [Chitinophagaceae bacterium]